MSAFRSTLKLSALLTSAVLAACSVSANGVIPCADDSSCPTGYPKCDGSSHTCVTGTPTLGPASVAIVGVEGHQASDPVNKTVRIDVTARAASGIQTISLAGGGKSYSPAADSASPLYRFDVDTTQLGGGAAASIDFVATMVAGDKAVGTVTSNKFTLNVDNIKPVLTAAVVAPANAHDGQLVTVDVTASKPLSKIAGTVSLGTAKVADLAEIALPTTADQGQVRHLGFTVTAATAGGSYSLSIVGTDVAGNVSDPLAQSFKVLKPFALRNLAIASATTIGGFAAGKLGSTIQTSFDLDASVDVGSNLPAFTMVDAAGISRTFAAPAAATVRGSTRTWAVNDAVLAGDASGLAIITASITDAAGNTSSLSKSFLIDQVPPGLTNVVIDRTNTVGNNSINITGVATKRLKAAALSLSATTDPTSCTCDGVDCASSTSATPVVACKVAVTSVIASVNVVASVVLLDLVGNQSAAAQKSYAVLPNVAFAGPQFAVVYSQSQSSRMTGGSLTGALIFTIPTLVGAAVASLTDGNGIPLASSVDILLASGKTLRLPLPTTSSTDIGVLKYTLSISNDANIQATAQTALSVVPKPIINSFTGSTPAVQNNNPFALLAAFTGGAGSISGTNSFGIRSIVNGIPLQVTPPSDKTTVFTLTVTNAAADAEGTVVFPTTVSVQAVAAPPPVNGFAVTYSDSGNNRMTGGSTVGTLTFNIPAITGATAAVLTDPLGLVLADSTAVFRAAGGTLTAPLPNTAATDSGPLTYTLTVTNAAGTSTANTTTLRVVPKPVITSFVGSGSPVTDGAIASLTAVFVNGTGAVSGNNGFVTTAISSNTPLTVTPAASQTTTYTLTVINAAADTAGKVVYGTNVQIASVPAPQVSAGFAVKYTESNSTKITGGSTTGSLTFTIPALTGGTTASLVDATGAPLATSANILAASGQNLTAISIPTTSATDSKTLTYTLTLTNLAGWQQTATTTLTVIPKPTSASFSSSTNLLTDGATAQLTAAFFGGTAVVTGNDGSSASILAGIPLTVTPPPDATTVYTLTVTNPAGDTAGVVVFGTTVSVQAIAAPSITGTFSVTYTGSGTNKLTGGSNTGTLTFGIPTLTATAGATATLTDSLGNSFSNSATILAKSNSTLTGMSIPATAGTDSKTIKYTLTLTNQAGTSATPVTTTLTVIPKPVITSFTASPTVVTNGNTASLTGTFTGGTGQVSGTNGFTTTAITNNTQLTVTPPSNTTTVYTLTVANSVGDAAGVVVFPTTASVQAILPPTIGAGFAVANVGAGTSSTNTMTGGNSVGTLSFTIPALSGTTGTAAITDSMGNPISDSATIIAASNGTLTSPVPTTAASDSKTIKYTLTLTNSLGAAATPATTTLTVIPKPVITSFISSPAGSPAVITNGNTASLTGTFTGGTGQVTGTNGFAPTAIANNTPLTVTPTSSLTTVYTLTVTNSAGDAAGSVVFGTTVSVQAVPAPSIGAGFAVANVGAGTSSTNKMTGSNTAGTLSFNIPALSGTTGTAAITDSMGNSISDSGTIIAASNGTLTNIPVPTTAATDSKTIKYTLTLTNSVGAAATPVTTTLTVIPKPVITSFTASPAPTPANPGVTVVTNGNTASLTGTFTGGTGQVTGTNGFTPTAITSNTPLTVTPASASTTVYTLTVTNSAGDAAGAVVLPTTVSVLAVWAPSIGGGFAVANVGAGASSANKMTGGNGAGTLSFSIPALSGTSGTAAITDSMGNSISDSGSIIAASNGTLTNIPVPTTAPNDSKTIKYTLTLTNAAGAAATPATTTLTVIPKPVITSFTGSPTTVTNGSTASLTATFTGGTGQVTGTNGFTPTAITNNTPLTVTPASGSTTVYTLTVANSAGDAAGSVVFGTTVSVQAFPLPSITAGNLQVTPRTLAFGAIGNLTFTAPTFTGTAANGSTISGGGGSVAIASGGTANLPVPTQTTTYTLTLTNQPGSTVTQTVTVLLADLMSTIALPVTGANGVGKFGATATSLGPNSNMVLLVGGSSAADCTGTIATGWVYWNTATNSALSTGALAPAKGRCGHTATLAGGKVIIAGGVPSSDPSASVVEIFDPTGNGTMTSASTGLSTGTPQRCFHTATALGNKVVLAGGTNCSNSTALSSIEIYDAGATPADTVVTPATLGTGRSQHTATRLTATKILLAGGAAAPSADVFTFVPGTDGLGSGSTVGATFNSMQFARTGHTATLLNNGKVYLVGGAGMNTTVDVYDPNANTNGSFAQSNTPSTAVARAEHVAGMLQPSGILFVAGGRMGGSAVPSTEYLDPGQNGFFNGPALTSPRQNFAMTNLGDLNFLFGGDSLGDMDVIVTP